MKRESGPQSNDLRREYVFDYSKAVRGKYYRRLIREDANVAVLEPDVAAAYARHGSASPRSHFHAEYQGQRGKFDLSGRMVAGNIGSKTALRLIRQWGKRHEAEIRTNWQRMKAGKPLETIEPLR